MTGRNGPRQPARRDHEPAAATLAIALALVGEAAGRVRDGVPADVHAAHRWRDVAVTEAVRTAALTGDRDGVRALAAAYDRLVLFVPTADGAAPGTVVPARTATSTVPAATTTSTGAVATAVGAATGVGTPGVTLVPVGSGERRARGAFSTPPELAAVMAERALRGVTAGTTVPRVVDPAWGGSLLRAVLARLLALGVPAAGIADRLYGVDLDPVAVAVCRAALAGDLTDAGHPCRPEDLAHRIVPGDALLGPVPTAGPGQEPGPEPGQDSGPNPGQDPGQDPGRGGPVVWHAAFPEVLAVGSAPPEPVTGWRGGFDVVVANPPWERLKVTAKDWAGAPPERLRVTRAAAARAVRDGGRHPLTGRGELNAYLPFMETCWRLLSPAGRACIVVPAGIASDRSAAPLLRALMETDRLDRLHVLDPAGPIFDGVSQRVSVALVDLRGGPPPDGNGTANRSGAEVAVGIRDPAAGPPDRVWRLDAGIPALVNPNTGTPPLCCGPRDVRLLVAAHHRWPVLRRRDPGGAVVDDPWQLRLVTPLHMTRDARWFSSAPGEGLLPLWEAKHAGLLDHRGGVRADPRYWVPESLVMDRFGDLCARGWLAGYRNVTTAAAVRTLLPCALPVVGVGNSLPLLSAPRLPLLLAALASLPVDYLTRQKHAGANLNFFKLEQVPLPCPEDYDRAAPWDAATTAGAWLLERLAAAVAWRPGLEGLAGELVSLGVGAEPGDGGIRRGPAAVVAMGGEDDGHRKADRRASALADLDAAHAVLLGWDRDDLSHALASFTALRGREVKASGRFVTAERVLDAFDRLAAAG